MLFKIILSSLSIFNIIIVPIKIMTKRKRWIMDYGIREWGDKFIDSSLIKWEEIKKFSGGDIIE